MGTGHCLREPGESDTLIRRFAVEVAARSEASSAGALAPAGAARARRHRRRGSKGGDCQRAARGMALEVAAYDVAENAHTFLQAWLTAQRMNHTQTPTSLGAGSTTQNLREPENTLSGKPRISTFARGGIVFPNPAVAFFYQSGTFAHRGA